MAKDQLSKGVDLLVTRLDRGYQGEERNVMKIDGDSGDVAFYDKSGAVVLSTDFESGSLQLNGQEIAPGQIATQSALKFYINGSTGNDAFEGTLAAPLATITEAARRSDLAGRGLEIILDADGIGRTYQVPRTLAVDTPFNILVGSSGALPRIAGLQGMPPVIYSKALTTIVAEQTDASGGYNFALNATIPNSTLTADPGVGGTTLSLVDASLYPSVGMAKVENELIRWTGKSGNDLTGCSRGFAGTTAAAHAIGVNALLRLDGYFVRVTEAATSTTLSAAISATATTVPLVSAASFPNAGYAVMPGGEIITFSSKSGNNLIGCVRGYNQTTPAAYSLGAVVQGGANILQRRQVKYNTDSLVLLKTTLPGAVVAGSKFKIEKTATTLNIDNWLPQYSNVIWKDLKLQNTNGAFNFFSSRFQFACCEIELSGNGFIQFGFNAGLGSTANVDISLWQYGGANIPVGNFEGSTGCRIERLPGGTGSVFMQGQAGMAGNSWVLINAPLSISVGSVVLAGAIPCMRGGTLTVSDGCVFTELASVTTQVRPLLDRVAVINETASVMRLSGMDICNVPSGNSALLQRRSGTMQLNNVMGTGNARYGLEALEGAVQVVDVGVNSTLTADPGASGTTISLTSAASFGTPGAGSHLAVQIENEIIFYTGKSGNDLTGCIRGMQGTVAAAHAIGVNAEQGTCIKGTLGGQKIGSSPVRSWSDFFAAAPASGRPSRRTADMPGFASRPFKISFSGMVAADAIDITAQAAFATPATASATVDSIWETAPPAIANGSTLRVTAGAAAFVGNYILTDTAGTLLSPATDTVVGVAQLSDDGKTITFPVGAQVTAMVLEYTPVSGSATGAVCWQAA